jgi:imidazolonepropionase-like amidohydrolase
MSSNAANPEKILLAIVGPQVIDAVSPHPISSGTVLVGSDGRIVAVGSSLELAVPSGVPTLHASGMTLLPGLIDAHVHLGWDKTLYSIYSAEDYQAWRRARNPERQLVRAGHHAQLALAAGVTTVRDCGADDFSVLGIRDTGYGVRVLANGLGCRFSPAPGPWHQAPAYCSMVCADP